MMTMQLPTFDEIEALHKKHAPSDKVFDLIFTHCKIIADIAEQLIAKNNLDIDVELVKVGCLLHDIGVYPLLDEDGNRRDGLHYITHGSRGEVILRDEGYPEVLWRIASHHTGVGLTKEDIENQNLPLPKQDYIAETKEERLVMYADKFHSKGSSPHFNSYDQYKELVRQFGEHKVEQFEEMANEFGIPDLQPLSEKYGYPIGS
jgi:uncharacterized protein